MKEWITIDEAVELTKLDFSSIMALIRSGELYCREWGDSPNDKLVRVETLMDLVKGMVLLESFVQLPERFKQIEDEKLRRG